MQARHMKGIDMFAKMGGYSPTFGVLGTVMGLVSVLANLADPAGLGESIATAFIATLFGVGAANILWLPISANLKGKDLAEAQERRLALAAILAIQAGDNPRIVAQKLRAHAGPEAEADASAETRPVGSTMAEAA
jgi:chemotaxis protein MotA